MADFDQTAYDHASSFIQQLGDRPDLLQKLAEQIKSVSPAAKRGRPKKVQ